MKFKRVFIEKKEDYSSKASLLERDFKDYLKIDGLENLRVLNIYDLIGFEDSEEEAIIEDILFEESLDLKYEDKLDLADDVKYFRLKYLDSQYNQREDSANEMARLILGDLEGYICHSELYIFEGISDKELDRIKDYYINKVETREIDLDKLVLRKDEDEISPVEIIDGFIDMDDSELEVFKEDYGIGMDLEDIHFCQEYFRETEKRDPSITEIKLVDTYWSDHCRHTTFMTEITNIEIEEGRYEDLFQEALDSYIESRELVYADEDRAICLMDLATINQKELKKKGLLDDKEDTEEVNAASIEIDVDVDGRMEKWLLMFKNETHNHPTEIEPFGGAATCLGGAIRDPLSGRSYVYQAMRITGSADPRAEFDETLEGKLAQRKITKTARDGYSSYGYEIGAATGYVREIYDQGYMAKRMEVGALVAAAPKENVYRGTAEAGDLIVLVGGRTGKDGLGGAVGSSRKHTEESLEDSGAEVQKGNPKVERKILRLFRRKEVSEMIKVCNDFGAGGVSVAIGELADGVRIDLDKVPLKYEGMNGGEIALSESQERMAALIDRENLDKFLAYAEEEDLEASLVAEVTEEKVLKMLWNGETIVSINRDFLDTNGIRKKNPVYLCQPEGESFFDKDPKYVKGESLKDDFINNLSDLNIASQKGLMQGFDESVGRGTVLAAYGGRNRMTQAEGMVAKIPVLEGETKTCSLMTYGFDPHIANWSTFHAGYYAVVESVARIVALGGSYEKIRLSLQEYFERIGKDEKKWGKPFTSLLGAFEVQKSLDIAAIGGKDSMSGSFEDLHVPPTLISFAVATDRVENILSPEFKKSGSDVVLLKLDMDENYLLDLEELKEAYKRVKDLVDEGKIISALTVKYGGVARSIAEMSLGNSIGFDFEYEEDLFKPFYGSLVLELKESSNYKEDFEGFKLIKLGETVDSETISLGGDSIELDEIARINHEALEDIFPLAKDFEAKEVEEYHGMFQVNADLSTDKPRVLIPIVTGTHGEYDMRRAFEKAGAEVEEFVIKTSSKEAFDRSLSEFTKAIEGAHILAFPDGKIMGNEPEAGGKLFNIILKNSEVKDAVERHIYEEDRLVIGIGAGFHALLKSGLIEYGEIRDLDKNSITIAENKESGFISKNVDIVVKSNLSPWFKDIEVGEVFTVPLASKEARVVSGDMDRMIRRGQLATVFMENFTGSDYAVDGLTSPDGKVIGFNSSIEREDEDLFKNIDKKTGIQKIFESGVKYFK